MLQTLIIVGTIYILVLISLSWIAKSKDRSSASYLMAGSNLGAFLGFFTFAATLFSTFTLLGMPDFFRVHGVGAWIFLAIADGIMVFILIWIGYALRKKIRSDDTPYFGMAGYLSRQYRSRFAGFVVFLGAFLFLIPYVAIQIRGVAIFLNAAFPDALPLWVWATGMVIVMLIYSEVGGLKAIIYSDVLQGILLLIVVWIIGIICMQRLGGMEGMFEQVASRNEELLSVPGPNGLFDFQFLFGSMIAIVLIPFTQPQVSSRLVIMRDKFALYRMALGVGLFAILVIFPTMLVGMYGAVRYPDATTSEFLGQALVSDQSTIIAVLVIIGLIAAAISTSDSQIFALGGEIRSLLTGEDQKMLVIARAAIALFAVIALVFALLSSDELVLLARTSFAGTALLAPMVFVGTFYEQANRVSYLPAITLVAILLFGSSAFGLLPNSMLGLRMDLILLIILGLYAGLGVLLANRQAALETS